MSKKIAFFLIVAIAITSLVALSLAWFSEGSIVPGSGEVIPGYFARGKGTKDNPYVINKPIHLYNLAWLQDLGRFNQTYDENGDLVQYHFVVEGDLDMTGYVLPPIGTRDYPFVGTFTSIDQTKPVTISNLTVSNVIDNGEVSLRPASVSDITGAEIVGMFGIIGQYEGKPEGATYESIVPSVSYFNLNNPIIRTQTEKSLVGLIAGYVNGKLHEVGVLGGQIVSGANNTSGLINSNISVYSLIGDRNPDVSWGGVKVPGDSGGPLKVDANDTSTAAAIDSLPSKNYAVEVPGSSERAFFLGAGLDTSSISGGISGYFFYDELVTAGNKTIKGSKDDYIQLTNPLNYTQQYISGINSSFTFNQDFADRFKVVTSSNATIATGDTAPTATDVKNVTVKGESITIPENGIWFKPESSGNCIISFAVSNMGGKNDKYKSVYRYTRKEVVDSQGNVTRVIDESSWTETRLTFSKGTFNNKNLVIYHFEITPEDIKAGAEYVVGATTGEEDDSIAFYFLALAGASDVGGVVTPDSKEIFEVNFIDQLPYTGTTILGPNNYVTTFVVSVTTSGSEASVSYSRESMTVHAEASASSNNLTVTKYEHVAVPPQIQQNE